MEFFIPEIKENDRRDYLYENIRKFVCETTGKVITSRKIYCISYSHNGKNCTAKVGEIDHQQYEIIIAIFESSDLYFVCTKNAGALYGSPLITGKNEIGSIVDFEL